MNMDQDYVYCLAVSPNFAQDQLIFAAKQSGLYFSSDQGKTWTDAYRSLQLPSPLSTTFVAPAAADDDQLIVFAGVEGHILQSSDRCQTWQFAELDSPPPLVTALLPSPAYAQDGVIWAATMQDGMFRSTSRGASWSGWNFGLYDPNINALVLSPHFMEDQTLFAGTQSGVFRSLNAGRSWRDLDFPVEAAPVLCLAMDGQNAIYAGCENGGLWVSKDFGNTWEPLFSETVEQLLLGADGAILALSKAKISFSSDAGKTWQPRPEFERDAPISTLAAPSGVNAMDSIFVGYADGQIVAY